VIVPDGPIGHAQAAEETGAAIPLLNSECPVRIASPAGKYQG
jgi:hypothetical protein